MALAALVTLLLASCAKRQATDAELATAAKIAVDQKIGAPSTVRAMKAVGARRVACGHAMWTIRSGVQMAQDFVYLGGDLIMDNDPRFNEAANECRSAIESKGLSGQ